MRSPDDALEAHRCQFTFSDGRRCRGQRAQLCAHHASTNQSNSHDLSELEPLCADLTTATNINRALAQVFLLTAQGRIPQKQAVAFGYLSQLLLQTVPGIRSEYVSVHGYQSWQNRLKSSLTGKSTEPPDSAPAGEEGGEAQEQVCGENEQPGAGVVEPEKGVSITPLFGHKEDSSAPPSSAQSTVEIKPTPPTPPSPDYTSIFHRSLDLLDRKYDTTPEGRREANALMLQLDLLNPAPAKPREDDQSSRRDRAACCASTPPAPETSKHSGTGVVDPKKAVGITAFFRDDKVSSGRGATGVPDARRCCARWGGATGVPDARRSCVPWGGEPALRPLPSGQSQRATADHFAASPSRRPESQFRPPRQKRQASTPATRNPHSTDWYVPASWSAPRPDPFPSRQEKLKRKLRTMSGRRQQHQNQSRAFWR